MEDSTNCLTGFLKDATNAKATAGFLAGKRGAMALKTDAM